MNRARTAIVIGGGTGDRGGLGKAGLEASVYEARPAARTAAGSCSRPPSTASTRRAIGADTVASAVAAGFPTTAITLRTHTGERRPS